MADTLRYILNILLWMVALMSGILSLARELLLIYRGEQVQQRSLFWNCVIIAFVISAGILYFLEHQRATEAETKLQDVMEQRPKLQGEFRFVITSQQQQETFALIAVTISNRGMPSIADGWQLTVKLRDGRSVKGVIQTIPQSIKVNRSDGVLTYYGADALYDKVSTNPIESGGQKSGLLLFNLPDVIASDASQSGTEFSLRFIDVAKNEYRCSQILSGEDHMPFYVPGITTPR